jgi:hypothetical protein
LACMIMTGLVIQSERSYKHMSYIQGLQIYKGSKKSKYFFCMVKMVRNFYHIASARKRPMVF